MKNFLARISWPGVIGALTTAAGIVSLPEVAALLPARTAAAVIGVGGLIQAVTKAVHKGTQPASDAG